MERDGQRVTKTTAVPLIVADWAIDPEALVTACPARLDDPSTVSIVVPAWLHGIDWVGDPWASVPCAHAQLDRITQLCLAAGFSVESAAVGDPDPVSAICDAVAAGGVDRILLFARGRHISSGYPFSVARRAERLTGLPLQSFATAHAPRPQRRLRLAAGHCRPSRTPRPA
jgi:hypothetical protein